jgi:hypothetical protein
VRLFVRAAPHPHLTRVCPRAHAAPMRLLACAAFSLVAACGRAGPCDPAQLSCTLNMQPPMMTDRDAGILCVESPVHGETAPLCVKLPPVLCGGKSCGRNEDCCFTSGACFDPASSASNCPRPPSDNLCKNSTCEKPTCAANSQCAADEACITALQGSTNFCTGVGRCQPRDNCGFCTPAGTDRCRVCGCDGNTYASTQDACVAGVRVIAEGACGSDVGNGFVSCGTDAQCAQGSVCCALTGHCFNPAEPWRCEQKPDGGGLFTCITDGECNPNSGAGGGGASQRYCAGTGCGTPGDCKAMPRPADCVGVVEYVCGCDGKTYVNACQAAAGGTRVASVGACGDAGM